MTHLSLSQLGLASAAEHLMFAIVPGGLVVLVSPLARKNFRLLKSSWQDSTWVSKALLTVAIAMLALELAATVVWRFTPGRSDSSFPASVLSLVASLSVCAVLRSELAAAFHPAEYPLHLLSATLIYDLIIGRQCLLLGRLHFSALHNAIALCKLALITLGYASVNSLTGSQQWPGRALLLSSFHLTQSCLSWLRDLMRPFFVPESPRFLGTRQSAELYNKFTRLLESDRTGVPIMKSCIRVLYWRHATYLILQLIAIALNLSKPFVFKYVMSIRQRHGASEADIFSAIVFTSLILVVQTLMEYAAKTYQNGILASTKSLLLTAIHEKMLKLSSETLAKIPSQDILSDDVDKVAARFHGVHGLIQKAFAVPIAFAMLYHLVGIALSSSQCHTRMCEFPLLKAREGGFIFTMNPILALGTAWYLTSALGSVEVSYIFQFFLSTDLMCFYIIKNGFYESEWHEGIKSMAVLKNFLMLEELERELPPKIPDATGDDTSSRLAVRFSDATISGTDDSVILQDVNLEIRRNDIAMISGPIGCGKTTLLRAILGEMKPRSGSVSTPFTMIAYCAQSPWIPPLTIRDIILAGLPYILERYRAVLIACCLDADLMLWPDGDLASAKSSGFKFTRSFRQRLGLARAFYAQSSLVVLDDALSAVDHTTSDSVAVNLFGAGGLVRSWDCTVVMVTNSLHQLRHADVIFEIKYDGEIWEHESFTNFIGSEPFPEHVDIETEIFDPDPGNSANDGAMGLTSDAHREVASTTTSESMYGQTKALWYLLDPAQRIMWLLWFLAQAVASVLQTMTPTVLVLTVGTGTPTPLYFLGFFVWDRNLTESLFDKLIRTTMNATPQFISATDVSILLDLFNHDFSTVLSTIQLPILQLVYEIVSSIGGFMLISAGAHLGFLSVLAFAVFCAVVEPSYSAGRSQLAGREAQTRVLLNSHITTVQSGIEHIRSFGQIPQALREGRNLIREAQRSKYHVLQCNSRLFLLCALLEALTWSIILILGLVFERGTSTLAFGVAVYFVMNRTDGAWMFVTSRHTVDEKLACVSRIKAFCRDTPLERDESTPLPLDGQWPAAGGLDFHHATITSADAAMIPGQSMKDVTVSVEPGEKVGLAGAPDQGQSSVILAVLRMVDYTGNISIDGRDIKSISRKLLRSKITTVTEDGITLTGSVRLNLDPYFVTDERFSDDDLISMLTRVRLWDIVRRRGGLDADISRMKFSKSHLQLLNLGRGALHKRRAGTRIVLIDEATSSLDADTEFQMSDFMDGEFAGATVLIVAQRLQCFETADTVLMMREGRVDSVLRQDEDTGEWYEDFEREESGASYM
ncbi:hypothetical protein PWT90_03238 [Aphanocladium album]|nr:hypothetical protein PWT90_03238 [Aphanocladium album]